MAYEDNMQAALSKRVLRSALENCCNDYAAARYHGGECGRVRAIELDAKVIVESIIDAVLIELRKELSRDKVG